MRDDDQEPECGEAAAEWGSESIRILCLAPFTPVDESIGSAVRLAEITSRLSRKNDVILVARAGRHARPSLGSARFLRVKSPVVFDTVVTWFSTVWRSISLSRQWTPDVIYETLENVGVGWIVSWITGVPLATEYNGLREDELAMRGLRGLEFLRRLFDKCAFRSADLVVVVTPGLLAALEAHFRTTAARAVVIGNGTNIEAFAPADELSARSRLGLDRESVYVMFLGTLFPWQGLDVLLNAFAYAVKANDGLRLLIVGDGPSGGALRRRARELGIDSAVVWAGAVPRGLVPVYLSASSMCVAPFPTARNQRIGLSPLKLYEYMAAGKAIVATRIAGVEELVRTCECGLLVLPDDPAELSSALLALASDPTLRRALGERGRAAAPAFSWDRIAQRAEIALSGVARASPRNPQGAPVDSEVAPGSPESSAASRDSFRKQARP